jgi:hypothetical protein
MGDTDRETIELHRGMGQLEGKLTSLIKSVENGFKQQREDNARDIDKMLRANSEQWEVIEKNRVDCADKKDIITRDFTDYRVKQARSSALTGGGTGGLVFILLELGKSYFRGHWIGG